MKKAIYPGSFDPFHLGHLNIIKKAANLFDELIVAVGINIIKQPSSNLNMRVANIENAIKNAALTNVTVISWSGYMVDLAKKMRVHYLVRGIRNHDDLTDEILSAAVNKNLDHQIETVFFLSDVAYQSVSSSRIKKILVDHDHFFDKK